MPKIFLYGEKDGLKLLRNNTEDLDDEYMGRRLEITDGRINGIITGIEAGN